MVTKVYGTANNQEIIFTHIDGDLWQTEVPFNTDGTWVCALYAENDIGNKAFICKMLFAITDHQMKIYVLDEGYSGDIEISGYQGDPELDEFRASFLDLLYKSGIAEKLVFTSTPEERGYTLEYILCERVGS